MEWDKIKKEMIEEYMKDTGLDYETAKKQIEKFFKEEKNGK